MPTILLTGQKIKFYTATQREEHLFPNPHTCPVLRQVNRAALVEGVNLPDMKDDRMEIERVLGQCSPVISFFFLSFFLSFFHINI